MREVYPGRVVALWLRALPMSRAELAGAAGDCHVSPNSVAAPAPCLAVVMHDEVQELGGVK